jgi:alkaline phosphatase D
MRRLFPLLIVAVVAAVPASAQAARGFTYGVAAGDVTSNSAVLWARANKPGNGKVEYSTDKLLRKGVKTKTVRAASTDDNTVQIKVTKLKPDSKYYFRFKVGSGVSDRGAFKTAPKATADKTIEFAYSGDADATPVKGKPGFNGYETYGRMAAEGNSFNVNLGDTIYSDSEIGGAKPALTVKDKWAKYKLGLALKPLRQMRGSTGIYAHWDDHEFINDFTRAENGTKIFEAGVTAFRDYQPVTYSPLNGLDRKFRWGKNLEVFFLDERSFRDKKASADHVCDNPDTKQPDLAPTAPQSTRDTFGLIIPSFKQPVSKACLDTINSPTRTFLGTRQLNSFLKAVKGSTATWKVVMTETPIQQFYGLPYDRWEGYAADRKKVLDSLSAGVKNLVFLATDTHANFYNEVRFQTLEPGGPMNRPFFEMVTGPVATNPFDKEINTATGRDDAGDLITAAFFKPEPPQGVGMDCAAYVYSYTQVKVTKSAVTLTPKDSTGKGVKEKDGKACGPFTIPAK